MKEAFRLAPGFYAAYSNKVDSEIPPDTMRLYVARLEAYDMPISKATEVDKNTSFQILFALADGNPQAAKAMLRLHDALGRNLKVLKEEAAKAK